MMRYFLRLAYDGSPFHGWQRQPNANSVQQCIEEALSVVMRQEVTITGAGRTDAGVNARVMYAHFDTDSNVDDIGRVINSLD
ncbi:MAG: tRNA pseudouridine(38-40) synthase TruA, partial [Muribaculaceae bacterium]|nr:tRNA pseudouridine(38-40) synthase TruA [Muribaculaceae bacterium]